MSEDQHTYSDAELDDLLPDLWDSASFAWANQTRADRQSGMADLRLAWRRADIPLVERQALFLRYGMGMTHVEIAQHMATTHQVIGRRVDAARGRLLAALNNHVYTETEAAHP